MNVCINVYTALCMIMKSAQCLTDWQATDITDSQWIFGTRRKKSGFKIGL